MHATFMTSCDYVIDDVIIQILALKFCEFHPQNRKIRRKFVAKKDLKFKKKQLDSCLMHFQSLHVKKTLKFNTRKFPTFFTVKRCAKYKAKLLDFFSPMTS